MNNRYSSIGACLCLKMKLEVIKRQGFHTDLTSSQLGTKLRTDDFADGGQGKTDLTPAVELTFLKKGDAWNGYFKNCLVL